jgi:hypothetical protein
MTEPLDALIDSGASLLGLPVERAWKPAIRANLEVTLRLASLFDGFEVPDELEPAPVYRVTDGAAP